MNGNPIAIEEKQFFIVHCADCKHEWAAFYFPMMLDSKKLNLLKSAGKARCPMCACKKVFCGKATPQTEERKDGK